MLSGGPALKVGLKFLRRLPSRTVVGEIKLMSSTGSKQIRLGMVANGLGPSKQIRLRMVANGLCPI